MTTCTTVANSMPAAAHRADTRAANQKSIERALSHMRTHLAEPLDLDQLATAASLSKFHFVRVFDELTGTTPLHFLSCLRMQRAKELLLNSEASITNICLEVGYASLGSFSKTFNSLVGLTPQDFRSLPKRLGPMQFAKAVWGFLASDTKVKGPALQGVVESPSRRRGFIFVGAFTEGVPQGAPYSGTVLLKPGAFRIRRPDVTEFHLLAAFIPFSADLLAIVTTLPVGLVASQRIQIIGAVETPPVHLSLRPMAPTDPPIVLALPALPPWRDAFARSPAAAAS